MSHGFKSILIILLCLVAMAAIFSMVANFNFSGRVEDLNNKLDEAQSWKTENEQLSDKNQSLSEEIEKLKNQLKEYEGKTILGNDQIALQKYTVEAGDSLIAICQKLGVDYRGNIALILGINGLHSERSLIIPGQTLYFPVVK